MKLTFHSIKESFSNSTLSMGKWFKNFNLFKIIATMFMGFLLLATINYLVIKQHVDGLAKDALEIEATNSALLLSQKILGVINRLESDQTLKKELSNLANDQDQLFQTLESGGILAINNQFIEPLLGKEKIVLKQSKQVWDSVRNNITILLNAPATVDTTIVETVLVDSGDSIGTLIPQAELQTVSIANPNLIKSKLFLSRSGNELIKSNNRLIQSITERNQANFSNLYFVLLGFLIFNSICIIAVLIITKKYVFKPLDNIILTSNKLAEGEIGVKAEYPFNNELGQIANGLNHLSDNLEHSKNFIENIEKGELDQENTLDEKGASKNSIEGALIKMRDQMKSRAHEDEVRKWTTEGLAKFIDILRASDNVNDLGDMILSNLVDYTNSNQAGLYLVNESDESNKHLELVSLYAFNTKKYDTKTYRFGEGLVGQTFLEKKTTYFIEVPENYIQITSGLGDSNPKSLLLVPLKMENEVYGVLEIASFKEYEEYQIKFIEKLCESVASTISAVKTNEKTKILLEESQQLTEQMQAQEEEMRQNMEELTATQEEMSRKEMAVNAQLEAINESLGMAEYSLDGVLLTSNGKFNEILGYDMSTINQASFQKLHGSSEVLQQTINEYRWSGWLNKIAFDGSEVEMKSSLTASIDEEGNVVKIIEIITQFSRKYDNNRSEHDFGEVEEELRQNLDSLEITQQQFIEKLATYKSMIEGLKSVANVIIYNTNGSLEEMSESVQKLVGEVSNITDVFIQPMAELTVASQQIKLNLGTNNKDSILARILKITSGDANEKYMIIWV